MLARPRFTILLAPQAIQHIKALDRRHHRLILDKLDEQLLYDPHVETRNRKPLEGRSRFGPKVSELRFGPDQCFRAFYDFDLENLSVEVLAIGVKEGNRLFIGDKEVRL